MCLVGAGGGAENKATSTARCAKCVHRQNLGLTFDVCIGDPTDTHSDIVARIPPFFAYHYTVQVVAGRQLCFLNSERRRPFDFTTVALR